MLKSKAEITRPITANGQQIAEIKIPLSVKWFIQQIHCYVHGPVDFIFDIRVNDITRFRMLAGPYTGVYTVNDTLNAGDKIAVYVITNYPVDRITGVYIQYDEITL